MNLARGLHIGAGAAIWAAHFALVYGSTALACAQGRPGIVRPVVIGVSIAAAAGCAALALRQRARRATAEHDLTAGIAWLALVAVVWEACAALLAPACR
jgi:hypothetical protein